MSILIKGMEMPKNCRLCKFCFGANNICPWTMEYATSEGRQKDCPLIEVSWCINTMHDNAPTIIEAEEGDEETEQGEC